MDSLEIALREITTSVQQKVYSEEFKCIQANCNISKQSSVIKLNPIIDSEGLLRVGGRIRRAGFKAKGTNPAIIPRGDHISTLLIRHYHERIQHQGRHFTEGAVRAGLWIVGGKRLISKVLNQ